MDAFFKLKKNTNPKTVCIENEKHQVILDPDILLLDDRKKNISLEILNNDENVDLKDVIVLNDDAEEPCNSSINVPSSVTKQSLKQLLSGNLIAQQKFKPALFINNEKPASKKHRSRTTSIISKEVEVIEVSERRSRSANNIALKQMLSGKSTAVLDKSPLRSRTFDLTNQQEKVSVKKFFQENRLNRFHIWSSLKEMNAPSLESNYFINNYPSENRELKDCKNKISSWFNKRKFIVFDYSSEKFDYNGKEKASYCQPATFKKRKISLSPKLFKSFPENKHKKQFKNTVSGGNDAELWTESLKPQDLNEMGILLPQETIQTFKYQLEQCFEKITHKADSERELLQNNWRSLLKNEENEDSEDDFVVNDNIRSETPLDHIPLFILYGPGIGKNLLLQLTLDEIKKEGKDVDNILEMNASVERSKKNIYDVCFEAATSKFLQTEYSNKKHITEKRKQQLGGGVLLFDEVDNLFLSDKLFFPMILKLLQVTKKPIIFTCNFLDCIPEQLLKITDFQQTNFMVSLPDTTVPYLNKKLGLSLASNLVYGNVNKDIRHTLLQLQLDRFVEIREMEEERLDANKKVDLYGFSNNVDYLSQIDVMNAGTEHISFIKQAPDYTVTDFLDSEEQNDEREEDDDYLSKHAKIRLDGTINYSQWKNVDRIKRPLKNYYDEVSFNKRQSFEIDVGGAIKQYVVDQIPNSNNLIKLDQKLGIINKSRLSRNLYLKLEYMQMNMFPYHMKLSPTRSSVNDYLENLQTSSKSDLKPVTLAALLHRNYQILDNRLNLEFPTSQNLFCYHYPFFKQIFAIDASRRTFVNNVLKITYEKGNLDNTKALKHLLKEKQISRLIFDQDPRIYWGQ
ncbi:hypothetical protein QEN19_002175 [Hanseniaspora menglaensis]